MEAPGSEARLDGGRGFAARCGAANTPPAVLAFFLAGGMVRKAVVGILEKLGFCVLNFLYSAASTPSSPSPTSSSTLEHRTMVSTGAV